jgi:hypothetical protein
MVFELKKLEVWSCVKIAFFLYGVLGLIVGIFYAIFLAFFSTFLRNFGGADFESLTPAFTGFLGIFMIIFLAFFYAVIGAIATAVMVWIYNLLAKLIGGIKMNFQQEGTIAQVPPSSQEKQGFYKYE